jgi:phage baseplate assembly protein W
MKTSNRAPAFEIPLPGGYGGGMRLALDGTLVTVSDADLVRQSILLLLATRPGERVMRPRYGCDLRPVLFLPNDHTTAGFAIHAVRRAVNRWEPRAIVLRVDATQDLDDEGRLNILLEYQVRGTAARQRIDYSLKLNGE